MSNRKTDHIKLALDAQTSVRKNDHRFNYEPLLSEHPQSIPETSFLGKKLKAPIWISSMTGGTEMAGVINRNLAKACNEFGLGMGLGSCRALLYSDEHFEDFNLRPIIGDSQPFFANLGIAQIDILLKNHEQQKIEQLIEKLDCDGLIVHVNPLQEYFQPEGDKIPFPPIDIIKSLKDALPDLQIIVKEVGQGMGPNSIKSLLDINIDAIDFGAFGGTNFAQLEMMRNPDSKSALASFANIGNSAEEMVGFVESMKNQFADQKTGLIISGGISDFLDGYYHIQKCSLPSIYGQGSALLKHARGNYQSLQEFLKEQIEGLNLAYAYLKVK